MIAVRIDGQGKLILLAPLGLGDLLAARLAPTPHALAGRLADYQERVLNKPWARQWPRLKVVYPPLDVAEPPRSAPQ